MIEIWCDGAASNNGKVGAIGGFGWVVKFENEKPILYGGRKDGATNQQMELQAAISALCFVQERIDSSENFTMPNEKIVLYTDSAYIANCYKQNWYKAWVVNGWFNSKKEPVANKDLWELLIPFFYMPNVEIIKVKGHASNIGNQIADKIAVAARTMGLTDFTNYRNNLTEELKGVI